MAKPLTVKAIENLKPGPKRREIPDGEVRNLYLQLFPSGKASWCFRYRFGGRSRKLTLGPSPEIKLKAARDLARQAHGMLAGGRDPGAEKKAIKAAVAAPASDFVEHVAQQFLRHYARRHLRPRTTQELERLLEKEIVGAWRGRLLSEIGKPDILTSFSTKSLSAAPQLPPTARFHGFAVCAIGQSSAAF